MKPFLLLVLLVAVAVASYLNDTWLPSLLGLLGDDKVNKVFDTIASWVQIGGVLLAGIGGLITLLGWRNRPKPPEEVNPESAGTYVQSREFEPTPALDSAPALAEDQSPYLGLSAFRREDARLFFGRHRETREALACLGKPIDHADSFGRIYRWLQIEGNSGAGKSSLVNAGMLPLIDAGWLRQRTGFQRWVILGPILPGEHPLERLVDVVERALAAPGQPDTLQRRKSYEADPRALACRIRDHHTEGSAYLLVVDQFEELFTFSDKEQKREFDRQLAHALLDDDCPLFLINTVRIDFLKGFELLPKLSELYNSRCERYLLKTISEQGLREVIEGPARLAGLEVSEVTTVMLQDASDEIGALPLVENALHALWERRAGNRLCGEIYRREKGLIGLLGKQADELLDRLDKALPKGKQKALELLLALTRIDDQGNIPAGASH